MPSRELLVTLFSTALPLLVIAVIVAYSWLADRALSLLPPCDFALVLPLLGSTDMWVKERACEVLGLWRRGEAVPDLRAGRTGMRNGQVAAVRDFVASLHPTRERL